MPATRATKATSATLKTSESGRLISKKAKIGGECSEAMSKWKSGGTLTHDLAVILARCRTKARILRGDKPKSLSEIAGRLRSKVGGTAKEHTEFHGVHEAIHPHGANVTHEDIRHARNMPEIPHPTSDEDVKRFRSQVESSHLFKSVERKMSAYAEDSPGKNPTLWSVGKHATGDIIGTLNTHKHESYEHIQWSNKRRQLHEQILSKTLNHRAVAKPGEKPKAIFLMGPPGSGKTVAGQPEAKKITPHTTTINADDIKAQFPEYRGYNAGAVHEESALLAEGPLMHRAMSARHHILFDLTGGNKHKIEHMTEHMHRHGYEVHIVSIHLPPHKSTGRAWSRFTSNAYNHTPVHPVSGKKQELGRFVPPKYVHENIGSKPEETYHHLKTKSHIKSYVQISTDVPKGTAPKELERGINNG